MAVSTAQHTITTTAASIAAADGDRKGIIISNHDNTNPVFLGADDEVTTSTGFRLPADTTINIETNDDLYAISGGSVVISVLQYVY